MRIRGRPRLRFRQLAVSRPQRPLRRLSKTMGHKKLRRIQRQSNRQFRKSRKSGVPVLLVAGDSDKTVPYKDNGAIYAKRFFDSGGNIRTIIKRGCDHHPHGLKNPSEIVEFIEGSCSEDFKALGDRKSKDYKRFNSIHKRARLECAEKFRARKSGKVAFLGGSITEMNGWRNMVQDDLKRRFPDTKFEFVDAGISSLGTTPHAFRMSQDIPELKDVDLLFWKAP